MKDLEYQGVDPYSRDEAGFTALMEAAMHGREEVAANLLGSSNINPEARDEDWEDSPAPWPQGRAAWSW